MAYDSRHFSVLAYADGFTLWHYRSMTDSSADINTPDYFATAADMVRAGDLTIYNAKDGNGFIFHAAQKDLPK